MNRRRILALVLMLVFALSAWPALGDTDGRICPESADGQHHYSQTETTGADCQTAGDITYTCDHCGYSYVQAGAGKKGSHTWGNWTTLQAATCTAPGREEVTCTVCGYKENRTIPQLAHTWGAWQVTVEPTDHSQGTRTRRCTVCGNTDSDRFDPEGTLRRKDRGDAVKALQGALNAAGYNCGEPDGIFGANTENAVKAFQTDHGLEPDGVAWPQTQAALAGTPAGATDEPGGGPAGGISLRWLPPHAGGDDGFEPPYIIEDGDSGLTLSKVADNLPGNGEYYHEGEIIEYVITLRNESEYASVTDIEIIDPMNGSNEDMVLAAFPDGLAPQEEQTVTMKHTVTADEAEAGLLVNTAYAAWWSADENRREGVCDTSTVRTGVLPAYGDMTESPELIVTSEVISKPDNGEYYHYADMVTYRWHATLTNGKAVTQLIVMDSLLPEPIAYFMGPADQIVTAANIESAGNYDVQALQSRVIGGLMTNTLYVWCRDEDGNTYENWDYGDSVHVRNDQDGLALDIHAVNPPDDGEAYQVGEQIVFEVSLLNLSKYSMFDLTISDDVTGLSKTSSVLRSQEDLVYATVVYTVTEDDALAGELTDTVTVTYTYEGQQYTTTSFCTVPIAPYGGGIGDGGSEYDLTLTKALVDPVSYDQLQAGDVITFRVTVQNNGADYPETLQVTDPAIGFGINAEGYRLTGANGEPTVLLRTEGQYSGAVAEQSYEYTVTKADVANGQIVNPVTALIVDDNGDILYQTSAVLITPIVSGNATIEDNGLTYLVKTVFNEPENGEYFTPGETIRFRLYVINPLDVHDDERYQVTDPMYEDADAVGSDGNPLVIELDGLDEHEIYYADVVHVVTEEDAQQGEVVNTAHLLNMVNDEFAWEQPATATAPTAPQAGGMGPGPEGPAATPPPADQTLGLRFDAIVSSEPKNGSYYVQGEEIRFLLYVTNTNETPFDDVIELTDPLYSGAASQGQDGDPVVKTVTHMDAGERFRTEEIRYTVTQEDVTRGYVKNLAHLNVLRASDGAWISRYEAWDSAPTRPDMWQDLTFITYFIGNPSNGSAYTEGETAHIGLIASNMRATPFVYRIQLTDLKYNTMAQWNDEGLNGETLVMEFDGLAGYETRQALFDYLVTSRDVDAGLVENEATLLVLEPTPEGGETIIARITTSCGASAQ